jgi:hypothetical protein
MALVITVTRTKLLSDDTGLTFFQSAQAILVIPCHVKSHETVRREPGQHTHPSIELLRRSGNVLGSGDSPTLEGGICVAYIQYCAYLNCASLLKTSNSRLPRY